VSDDTIYGVFTVAHVRVALPLSELREVIPSPPRFESLLATAPGLVGAVNVRHQVIPVLDLRHILGLDTAEPTDVVVVVSYQDLVFGLLACAVTGVVRLDDSALLGMEVVGEGPSLFSRTFERPGDGAVVCVLDCAAIRSLPGMPLAQDTGTIGSSSPATPATSCCCGAARSASAPTSTTFTRSSRN
jgi:purine-binding chemotaxis protein CheW